MSVLVKGIKKPKDCDSCGFDDVVNCHLWKIMDSGEIHPECPIVEVKTPHGDLIDKDNICFSMTNGTDQDIAEEALKEVPTVIEAEDE